MRLKVRLSALVAQLQLIVRLSGPSSSSTEKEAHEGIRAGERHSMCSCSIGDVAGRLGRRRPLTNWDGHAQASANLPYQMLLNPSRPHAHAQLFAGIQVWRAVNHVTFVTTCLADLGGARAAARV